uniref:Uncharacterized protein n=1 Tax=Nelumbo nucifera TaxID=4432 RepID=A0A822ZMB3_NELNU|nr:TPA_asm: hypothetical protein HUJ06_004278 [Nelumbo nucifera]
MKYTIAQKENYKCFVGNNYRKKPLNAALLQQDSKAKT